MINVRKNLQSSKRVITFLPQFVFLKNRQNALAEP